MIVSCVNQRREVLPQYVVYRESGVACSFVLIFISLNKFQLFNIQFPIVDFVTNYYLYQSNDLFNVFSLCISETNEVNIRSCLTCAKRSKQL